MFMFQFLLFAFMASICYCAPQELLRDRRQAVPATPPGSAGGPISPVPATPPGSAGGPISPVPSRVRRETDTKPVNAPKKIVPSELVRPVKPVPAVQPQVLPAKVKRDTEKPQEDAPKKIVPSELVRPVKPETLPTPGKPQVLLAKVKRDTEKPQVDAPVKIVPSELVRPVKPETLPPPAKPLLAKVKRDTESKPKVNPPTTQLPIEPPNRQIRPLPAIKPAVLPAKVKRQAQVKPPGPLILVDPPRHQTPILPTPPPPKPQVQPARTARDVRRPNGRPGSINGPQIQPVRPRPLPQPIGKPAPQGVPY